LCNIIILEGAKRVGENLIFTYRERGERERGRVYESEVAYRNRACSRKGREYSITKRGEIERERIFIGVLEKRLLEQRL